MMFWDMLSLGGYLVLNVVITRVTLEAERNGSAPPSWIRPVIVLSIPWAVSIHTVTAFLYSGLPGRSFWLTAVMAPRFLASAFAAGPALLVIVALIVRRLAGFDTGREGIGKLAVAIAYALTVHVFLVLLELFTVLYSQVPEHVEHYRYLYLGLEGGWGLAPLLWLSSALAVLALVVLLAPRLRRNESLLAAACLAVFVSLWLDKGLALIVGGFVPSPFGRVSAYVPTLPEAGVTAGIWAAGLILITVFMKIVMVVRTRSESRIGN
jgi:molybdopterin-containing oxidoreductase family membrane subunit